MKKYIVLLLLFFVIQHVSAAVFTIQNFSGEDIRIDIRLAKTFGSTSMRAFIPYGQEYRFNTGAYGVVANGISWNDGQYYIPITADLITPLSFGLVLIIMKNQQDNGYIFEWVKTKAYLEYLSAGGFPQGSGKVGQAY